MALSLLLLLLLPLHACSPEPPSWWVEAAAQNVFEDDHAPASPLRQQVIDIQMMAGETEHRQIVARLPSTAQQPIREVSVSCELPGIPSSALRWRQQGYVNCSSFFYQTIRPAPGFFPDPLWDPSDGEAVLWPGVTASFWVSVTLPPGTAAANFSGTCKLVAGGSPQPLAQVPLQLEAWPILLPPLASAQFTGIMSWIDSGDFSSAVNMSKLILPAGGREVYWEMMCDHRMPPNKLYVAPAFNFHTKDAAYQLELLTNHSVNGSVVASCGKRGGGGGISVGNVELLAGHRLPNYTQAQIGRAIDMLTPTMDAVERLGAFDRVYACEPHHTAAPRSAFHLFPFTSSTGVFQSCCALGLRQMASMKPRLQTSTP